MRRLLISQLVILGFVAFSAQADSVEDSNSVADNWINTRDEGRNLSQLIFGGQSDFQEKYNFVADLTAIFHKAWTNTRCSGVVLTTKIVLTVAQCVTKPGGQVADSVVVAIPPLRLYTFFKKEIIIHPSFKDGYEGNVALLRKDTRFSNFMRGFGTPPTVPGTEQSPYSPNGDEEVTIAGWGLIPGFKPYPRRVQWAKDKMMSEIDCVTAYGDINPATAKSEMLCTESKVAGACTGDWGGPLLNDKDDVIANALVLRGLTMYRRGQCTSDSGNPTAYYNVERVGTWIRSIVEASR